MYDIAKRAIADVGFVSVGRIGPHYDLIDGPNGRPYDAVRLWMCGDVVKPDTEPLPDVAGAVPGPRFPVLPLETLVRMKLSANRTIDNVHIRDLTGVGLIDATWPDKFPEVLAQRLREILADPDG